MPTYRRSTCVERSIACFLAQETHLETELIICNTDIDYPLTLDDTFTPDERSRIKIYNNNIDRKSGKKYTNTGAIRRDGVSLSTGQLYITWDDDDIFLPWNIQQCYDGIVRTGKRAWKPNKSIVWTIRNPTLEQNVLEATAIMWIEEAIFAECSGAEGMQWYNKLIETNGLIEDEYSIPGYCYYWGDPVTIGGHKQGNVDDIYKPNNFVTHMENCTDNAKRPLTKKHLTYYNSIVQSLKPIYDILRVSKNDLYIKYVKNFFEERIL